MAGKVFIEKKCYDVYEYVGECPQCHKPQQNSSEKKVDILCDNCCVEAIEQIVTRSDIPNVGSIVFDTYLLGDRQEYVLITPKLNIIRATWGGSHITNMSVQELLEHHNTVATSSTHNTLDNVPRTNKIVQLWKRLTKTN